MSNKTIELKGKLINMEDTMKEPKVIGSWSGNTHGKLQFATKEEAMEFAKDIPNDPLGWYWHAGEIEKADDGTYWVVIP